MRIVLSFVFCVLSFCVFSQQEVKLAQHYFSAGEYEKAAELYKKISDKVGFNDYYYNQYIESLMAANDYDKASSEIKTTLKQKPQLIQLYVTFGMILERQGNTTEAEKQYRLAINKLSADEGSINALGNSFIRMTKYELAKETFLLGEKKLGNKGQFAYSLAEIYRRLNDVENMVKYYLISPVATSERISNVQNYMSRFLYEEGDYDILRAQLIALAQEDPDNLFYGEMIQWVYVTRKQYDRALRQARSMDSRLEEDGSRIYNIAQIALNDRDYDTAIKAFEYIINGKGEKNRYYIEAKKDLLKTKRRQLISTENYPDSSMVALKREYTSFLDEQGRGRQTALMILELAELEAIYLNDLPAAIITLTQLIQMPGVNNYIEANAKLDLGDYYLMQGEVWDATLLYSQVDKEFKEDYLGERARFKNAMLSYYIGDFDWAQEQFDILKSATTKLISNDAIDRSVFIMDNANLDTSYAALKLFAEAELLLFQNRRTEAFQKLDSILSQFPEHALEDDVLFVKAEDLEKRKDYASALALYETIVEKHAESGIRADNALYAMAKIQDRVYNDEKKAMELYEKLFLEFSDSTFSVEARKRFRQLRGDTVQ